MRIYDWRDLRTDQCHGFSSLDGNRDLQVEVCEGNADSQLITGQRSSEPVNVLAHVLQLGPVAEACAVDARS